MKGVKSLHFTDTSSWLGTAVYKKEKWSSPQQQSMSDLERVNSDFIYNRCFALTMGNLSSAISLAGHNTHTVYSSCILFNIPFLQPMNFRSGWCHCNAIQNRLALQNRSADNSVNSLLLHFNPHSTLVNVLESQFGVKRHQPSKELNKDQHQCHFANVFG